MNNCILFTVEEYINPNGSKLLIFKDICDHKEINRLVSQKRIEPIDVSDSLGEDVEPYEAKQDFDDLIELAGNLHFQIHDDGSYEV